MRRKLLTTISLFAIGVSIFAQGVPFRMHRYDGFKVHPVTSENIVFYGNSITNMHEWWEAFGDAKVLNRGVNGAESPIMLQHLEAVLAGKPSKIFFMMGTNDLGTKGLNTPAQVAKNVRIALMRCAKESPQTQVFFQSILPCRSTGVKNAADIPVTNDSIQKICKEMGVTYVDLYDDLKDIPTNKISKDALHLTMAGYRIWCNKIASYVGDACVYPKNATDKDAGLGGINGMRATYFAALPVTKEDVIVLGDDGNDWHELLHSAHVKQRGGSWGYQAIDLGTMKAMLPNIFKGLSSNKAPKMVLVTLGYKEINNAATELSSVESQYKEIVDKIKSLAPGSAIKLMAVYPSPKKEINTTRTTKFNAYLQTLAEGMDNVEYVADSYAALVKDGVVNAAYFSNNYMQGKGYAKLSQVFAKTIGEGVTPTTDEQAEQAIATFDARTSLYNAIATAQSMQTGNDVGQYPKTEIADLLQGIEDGYTLLSQENVDKEVLTKKASEYASLVEKALPKINQPIASTTTSEHWYQLFTPNRSSRYLTSQGADKALVGGEYSKNAATMWKFVKRNDGSYDIINRKDGAYISPAAAYNKAIATTSVRPSKGWQVSYANQSGLYIISSGKVELNQTLEHLGWAIYNWSSGQSGTDRSDAGCVYCIANAPEAEEEPVPDFTEGDVTISLLTGAFGNPSSSYNKLWTSTRTEPQISFSSGTANNMGSEGDNIVIYSGIKKDCTYTIDAGTGYEVAGYSFAYQNVSENTSAITIVANGKEYTTSTDKQTLKVEGLNEQTTSFTLKGENKGVVLTDFIVNVRRHGYTAVNQIKIGESKGNGLIYDLHGRRITSPQRGNVYIVNKKKVVM